MSSLQNCDTVCVFCYKTINSLVQTTGNVDNAKKFTKLLDRFVGCNTTENVFTEQGTHNNLSKFLLCCNDCREITNQFCELYHQFKLLELQLDLKLNKLVDKLEHANKVPTRWIQLNKLLDETFSKDCINKSLAQNTIRNLRQNIVKAANQRQRTSQPRISVKKGKFLANLDETQIEANNFSGTTNFHNGILADTVLIKRNERFTPELIEDQFVISEDYEDCSNSMDDTALENSETKLENQFPCKLCKKQFPRLSQLQQHINMKLCVKIYKDANGDLVCPECGKRFRSISLLSYHLEFHKDPEEWKWQCRDCGRKCVNKVSLNVHMRTHTQEKPFVCRFCGRKYGYNISLKTHLLKWHGHEKLTKPLTTKKVRRETVLESNVDSEKKRSRCKICKQSFPKLQELKKHTESKLCKKKKSEFGNNVKCEGCCEMFISANALWIHQQDIHGDKVCLECGKQFRGNYNYNLHLEYHKDPKEWKFECKICGRKCPSKYKMKEHSVNCTKQRNKRALKGNRKIGHKIK